MALGMTRAATTFINRETVKGFEKHSRNAVFQRFSHCRDICHIKEEDDAAFRNGRYELLHEGNRDSDLFELHSPAEELFDRDPVLFHRSPLMR